MNLSGTGFPGGTFAGRPPRERARLWAPSNQLWSCVLTPALASWVARGAGSWVLTHCWLGVSSPAAPAALSVAFLTAPFLSSRALIFVSHGAGEHCGRYDELAQMLKGLDMLVFAHDHGEYLWCTTKAGRKAPGCSVLSTPPPPPLPPPSSCLSLFSGLKFTCGYMNGTVCLARSHYQIRVCMQACWKRG